MTQNIRPLQILLLNLMPMKIETETQLARVLGNTPIQIELELIAPSGHLPKNTPQEHMLKFYKTFDEVKDRTFDGLVITGAPVELMDFEEVDYWPELCRIMEWSKTHVHSTLHICWGAQAALYYHYGIPKHLLKEKMFGVFPQKPLDLFHPLLRGFDDVYNVPQSRHTEVRFEDIALCKDLQILSYSEISGIHLISDLSCRKFFTTGHSEYDADTLAKENFRDKEKGLPIQLPYNYFPDNDPTKKPIMTWRNVGTLMFTNWLNYFVYQRTPYNINDIH